ncbi:hypothetical protein Tco_0625251 [Tanacetum coccineum]|uniref:Uncharacterized protein n=1 Tax=Tanacetum coccineum TaxID=301880 RepID=A0ABQ4WG93_9ASTR
MEDRDMTMEEYVQYETEKALRMGKVYNWETAMYGKISWRLDDDNINDLRIFETRFPAIVYDDALTFESCFSSETTVSPQHVDELIWKNETSLSEYDDEKYNVISYNDLFLFNIIFADELKLDTDNDDDKIDTKIPSYNMCDNEEHASQNVKEYEDERVVLANLIANLKLDHDENKKILKKLKKAKASLTRELNECKSAVEESNDI